MTFKVLVMGLSGAGKTTLANKLEEHLKTTYTITRINADEIRSKYNDWDFTITGRLRQAERCKLLAKQSNNDIVICDFIAPIHQSIDIFEPNYIIWLNTVSESQYKDTDQLFENPTKVDKIITNYSDIDLDELYTEIGDCLGAIAK